MPPGRLRYALGGQEMSAHTHRPTAVAPAEVLDPVCGMQVDPAKAAGTSQYGGKTYYFCSKGCKTKFDANPTQYVK